MGERKHLIPIAGPDTRASFGAVEVVEELCVTGYWKQEFDRDCPIKSRVGKGPISLLSCGW